MLDGDDGVAIAVHDERGCGGGGELCFPAWRHASGDLDGGTQAGRGGGWRCFGGEGHREEAAERDAKDGEPVGVDGRACSDPGEGVVRGAEPDGEVVAVQDQLGCGALGVGALEEVWGVGGDAGLLEHGGKALEPVGARATGAVQEKDGGMGAGGGGFDEIDVDVVLVGARTAGEGVHRLRDAAQVREDSCGFNGVEGKCIYAGRGRVMRGAMLRRARHWIANRGWSGLGAEVLRRGRMAARGEAAGERPLAAVQARHPFDVRYGVETDGLIWGEQMAWGEAVRTEAGRAGAFWATGYYGVAPSVFWAVLDRLALDWERYSFVDIGCGKGRALLLALRYPFRRAVGVELSPELAAVAQRNLLQMRAPWRLDVPAEAFAGDATSFQLPDGPALLYFYHPFAAPVMRTFLEHVRREAGRRGSGAADEIYLLYMNPELDALVMEQMPDVVKLWDEPFAMDAEDAAADRFGSHDERAIAYRLG